MIFQNLNNIKGMSSGAGMIGSAVGQLGNSLISNGLESGAGSTISNIGGTIGGVVSNFNPVLGGIISAGSGVLGGITNSLFGSKLNEENIQNINNNISNANNTQFSGGYDSLLDQYSDVSQVGSFSQGYIGKDGVFSNKARNKFNELKDLSTEANLQLQNRFINSTENANQDMMLQGLRNIAAFGGDLHTYGGIFPTGLMEINNGGTHEENPNQGVFMGYDTEGNPNLVEEGETIYNDYVYSNRLSIDNDIQNKYKLKKDMTYADASKKLVGKYEEMPNDPIAKRTMNVILSDLQQSQENLKAKKQLNTFKRQLSKLSPQEQMGLLQQLGEQQNMDEQTQYKCGGKINKFSGLDEPSSFLSYPRLQMPMLPMYTTNLGYDYNNMWNPTVSFKNSNLKGNIPYNQDGSIDASKVEQDPSYKQFTKDALNASNLDYWNTLSDKTGKSIDFLKENYDALRNDGKYGWIHLTPNKTTQYNFNLGNYSLNPNNIKIGNLSTNPIEDAAKKVIKTPILNNDNKGNNTDDELKPYPTWLRYAPVVGSAISSISSLFSKPDESSANAILNASRNAGKYKPVGFNPIGDYLTYRPFDRDYYINKLNAQSGSTRRAIANQGNGNRGNVVAGLLAADNNAMQKIGDLGRQAEEYNNQQRVNVATFNRGTNQYNSEGIMKAAMANQQALMNSRNTILNGTMQAERLRQAARAQLNSERSANLTNLFNNLGNIGRENMNFNILNSSPAFYGWGMTNTGMSTYNNKKRNNSKKK